MSLTVCLIISKVRFITISKCIFRALFRSRNVHSVRYSTDSLTYLGPKIWNIVPQVIKNSDLLSVFKTKTKQWLLINCYCRLRRPYLQCCLCCLYIKIPNFSPSNLCVQWLIDRRTGRQTDRQTDRQADSDKIDLIKKYQSIHFYIFWKNLLSP